MTRASLARSMSESRGGANESPGGDSRRPSNEELVRHAYEAYAAGDIAAMMRFVDGDLVMVSVHTPGLDTLRARQADDRNYDVLTIRDGRIVAMRACKKRSEALGVAGVSDS